MFEQNNTKIMNIMLVNWCVPFGFCIDDSLTFSKVSIQYRSNFTHSRRK